MRLFSGWENPPNTRSRLALLQHRFTNLTSKELKGKQVHDFLYFVEKLPDVTIEYAKRTIELVREVESDSRSNKPPKGILKVVVTIPVSGDANLLEARPTFADFSAPRPPRGWLERKMITVDWSGPLTASTEEFDKWWAEYKAILDLYVAEANSQITTANATLITAALEFAATRLQEEEDLLTFRRALESKLDLERATKDLKNLPVVPSNTDSQ